MLQDYVAALGTLETYRRAGRVCDLVGLLVESEGPGTAVGDFCEILATGSKRDKRVIRAQVVGFRAGHVLLMPLEETGGLQLGDTVVARPEAARVEVGAGESCMVGRGTRVIYSNASADNPCIYWSLCMPAFRPERTTV